MPKRKPAKFKNGSAVLKRPSENNDVSIAVRKKPGGDHVTNCSGKNG